MKKTFLISVFLVVCAILFAQVPTIVSTTPSNKNIVLEEYTGKGCTYCPDGHKKANQIAAANPGRVVVINIHQGSYASGTPNYTTSFGNSLANQTGLTGYPAGTVNRRNFPEYTGGSAVLTLSRSYWSVAADKIKAEPSVVNIAAKATINVETNILTVLVEAYYTGEYSAANFNMLNVAILQDNVIGPQSGASSYYPEMVVGSQYRHNHMLRHLLTGQWGDTIKGETTKISEGTFFTKEYTYLLPENINAIPLAIEDIKIAAFIAEDKKNILTGVEVIPEYLNNLPIGAEIKSVEYKRICDNTFKPIIKIKNIGYTNITSFNYNISAQDASIAAGTISITALSTLSSVELELPDIILLNGNYIVNLTIDQLNGETITPLTNNKTVNIADIPTVTGNITLNLTQDQYGSETTWNVKNSAGTIVKSGGPYSNLSASGIQLHVVSIALSAGDCYTFTINDSYGDGINAGFGAGNFNIVDDNSGTVLVNNNGKFGSSFSFLFKSVITEPTILTKEPEGNNVEINAAVKVKFSIPITQGTAFNNITITPNEELGTITPTINGNILTIAIENNFKYETTYTVTIPANAITDFTATTWNFTTKDFINVPINSVNSIKIYPNPSNGLINIVVSEKSDINVYDVTGKLIDNFKINSNEIKSFHQSAGMYFVQITDIHGKVTTEKVIIE